MTYTHILCYYYTAVIIRGVEMSQSHISPVLTDCPTQMLSKRVLFSTIVIGAASVGAFSPLSSPLLHTSSRLSLAASATPLSDVYTIPDQPKRFSNAKAENNKRYIALFDFPSYAPSILCLNILFSVPYVSECLYCLNDCLDVDWSIN